MLQNDRFFSLPWLFGARRVNAARHLEVTAAGATPGLPPELANGSPIIEACRTLRANLSPGGVPPPLLVLGTSASRSAALLAAGLAVVLAEERPTVLVDADLRQPLLHTLFGMDLGPGLADALEADAREAYAASVRDHLWLLPAGRSQRGAAELLQRPSLGPLTEWLARTSGSVLYYAPGRWEYPDALLLAAHVRVGVLAVQAGVDSMDRVRRVKVSLERAGVDVLGFALLEHEG